MTFSSPYSSDRIPYFKRLQESADPRASGRSPPILHELGLLLPKAFGRPQVFYDHDFVRSLLVGEEQPSGIGLRSRVQDGTVCLHQQAVVARGVPGPMRNHARHPHEFPCAEVIGGVLKEDTELAPVEVVNLLAVMDVRLGDRKRVVWGRGEAGGGEM